MCFLKTEILLCPAVSKCICVNRSAQSASLERAPLARSPLWSVIRLLVPSMLPWTPSALQHHRYIGLDRAGERKKESLGCKTNQVVPITGHLLGNDLAARKLIDLDPNKPNMAKGSFVHRATDDAALILARIDREFTESKLDAPLDCSSCPVS